ncbi:MAG: hypothetical protein NC489_20905 [Ruminococcus flavefaciens]|nr:hypothetical protein [Ruminococcus flavefaciens]
MKLISTVYSGDQLEATLTIQSKNTRTRDDKSDVSGPLITRYRSKVGNESLIFNPTVALVIRGRDRKQSTDAWIPWSLIYRFTASLSHVYHSLQTEKLYNAADGTLYVDRNIALSVSRRLSLFRNSITLTPGVIMDRTGKPMKAIDFIVDEVNIGTMGHNEVLTLIDLIDHLDIANYSLTAGIIDELETMNTKFDQMKLQMDRIERLLQTQPKPTQEPRSSPMFNWQPNGYGAL